MFRSKVPHDELFTVVGTTVSIGTITMDAQTARRANDRPALLIHVVRSADADFASKLVLDHLLHVYRKRVGSESYSGVLAFGSLVRGAKRKLRRLDANEMFELAPRILDAGHSAEDAWNQLLSEIQAPVRG